MTRLCINCGREFTPYRNGVQRYCSKACLEANHLPGGDGMAYETRGHAERDFRSAPRPQPRPLQVRQVTIQGRHYHSLDANAYLEEMLEAENARPGHVYG